MPLLVILKLMPGSIKKIIDTIAFIFSAFLGAIYLFYSIASKDVMLLFITAGIYLLGLFLRRIIFRKNSSVSLEVAFIFMSALVAQALITINDKGSRLEFLDNYIVINTFFIAIAGVIGYIFLKKLKNSSLQKVVLFIYLLTLFMFASQIGDLLTKHDAIAFLLVGSPLTYISLLNFGLVKSHFH